MTNALQGAFGIEGKSWHDMVYINMTEPAKPAKKTADEVLTGLIERGGLVAKHGLTRPCS